MRVMTWNIQWAKGMDQHVDPERIASFIEAQAPDIIALQEVSRNYSANTGNTPADQPEWFKQRFAGRYQVVFGEAVESRTADGKVRQFGNLILSRYPIIQVIRHSLPHLPDPQNPGSPRAALELLLQTPTGPLRFLTSHLSYHSGAQRRSQIEALRRRHAEIVLSALFPPARLVQDDTPMRTVSPTNKVILCGDFNAPPTDAGIQALQQPYRAEELSDLLRGVPEANEQAAMVPPLVDGWNVRHGDAQHSPTLSVHDTQHNPVCFDYIFLSANLSPYLTSYNVIADCKASDHQPCLAEFCFPENATNED
jgi:endonuclease/exonuclease/phosphatase family metal-dependent hydrolase